MSRISPPHKGCPLPHAPAQVPDVGGHGGRDILPYDVFSRFAEVHRERHDVEAMCVPWVVLYMEVDEVRPASRRVHCQNEKCLRERKWLHCFCDLICSDPLALDAFAFQASAVRDFHPAGRDIRPEVFPARFPRRWRFKLVVCDAREAELECLSARIGPASCCAGPTARFAGTCTFDSNRS
jgi:hypothetical protein